MTERSGRPAGRLKLGERTVPRVLYLTSADNAALRMRAQARELTISEGVRRALSAWAQDAMGAVSVGVSEKPVYPWPDATFKVCAHIPVSLADDLLICQAIHGLSGRAVSALAVARWVQ